VHKNRLRFLVILILLLSLSSTMFATKALLLYKGSEQGYGYNVQLKYIAPELKKLLIDYDVIDVETDSFKNTSLNDYELVVSCYYTSQMNQAKQYLKSLFDYICQGGKLLIINNIGASIDSSGTNNPGLQELNSVYNLLGVSYTYSWKKSKPIQVSINSEFQADKTLSFEKERDVESYLFIGSNIEPLIQVVAGDNKTYNTAFLSPIGGMIGYNYLLDDNGKVTVNLSRVFGELIYGDWKNYKLLVVGKDNYELRKALDYTLLDYDWTPSLPSVLFGYEAVIYLNDTVELNDAVLNNYMLDGGTVVILSMGSVTRVIKEIEVTNDIFPVPNEFKISWNKSVRFQEQKTSSEILLTSSDNDVLSWKIEIGSGQLIYYPIDLLEKRLRGLFIQTVFSQLPISIQPVINSYSIYLDDFPLPAYNRKIDALTREFGDITDNNFYYNIWWPMMKELAKKFGIKYTTAFVANYNASVTWPFSFQEYINTPEQKKALQELLDGEYEIGVHGYNHIPLTKSNWKEDELAGVLRTFKIFLRNVLNEQYVPYTYVAPNNIIDEFGAKELLKVFPDITSIGTTYKATDTISEFSVIGDKTVVIPRTTSGYYPVQTIISDSVLSIMTLGTFQYFVHPDDVFSTDRNPENKTWKEMYESIQSFISTIQMYYPFLNNHFSSESAEIIYEFLTKKPHISLTDKEMIVSLPLECDFPRYYYLRANKPFTISGGRIVFVSNDLYVIAQFDNVMKIVF